MYTWRRQNYIFLFCLRSLQCKTLPRCTSQVQIKHHPDITIPCPANIATNGQSTSDLDTNQRLSNVQTTVYGTINQSQSPKITLTSHPSADDKTLTEADAAVRVSRETNKQQLPKNGPRVDSLTKKALTRGMAIDRSDSSGGKHCILTTRQGTGSKSRRNVWVGRERDGWFRGVKVEKAENERNREDLCVIFCNKNKRKYWGRKHRIQRDMRRETEFIDFISTEFQETALSPLLPTRSSAVKWGMVQIRNTASHQHLASLIISSPFEINEQ